MSGNARWEIHLLDEHFNGFSEFMSENGFHGFTASRAANDTWWIICYPSEDIKLIAKLRFGICEVADKFGTNIDLTGYPNT